MASLNFDNLKSLQRLVVDIFSEDGFSCDYRDEPLLRFSGNQLLVPEQKRTYYAYAGCLNSKGDDLEKQLKGLSTGYHLSSLYSKRVESFVVAHTEQATVQQRETLDRIADAYEVRAYLWDRDELESLLLREKKGLDFVVARNFSDYGSAVLGEEINRARELTLLFRELPLSSAYKLFDEMFKSSSSHLQAWLVFDQLVNRNKNIALEDFSSLYHYCSTLMEFDSLPIRQSVLETLRCVIERTNFLKIDEAVESEILSSSRYEDWFVAASKITDAKLRQDERGVVIELSTLTTCRGPYDDKEIDMTIDVLFEPGRVSLPDFEE